MYYYIGYFTGGLLWAIYICLGSYFYFCLKLTLETWANTSLTQSLWVHDLNHTHSLASFQWSGLSTQRTLKMTENCLNIQKWCCANKVRNGPLQPAKAAPCAWHLHAETRPLPPLPPFLLAQHLSSKQIAPIHNMWPNLDDAKKRQWPRVLTITPWY